MSASVTSQQSELLTSWKEIASYLGKGVRTVQRWEQRIRIAGSPSERESEGDRPRHAPGTGRLAGEQWSQRPKEFALAYGPRITSTRSAPAFVSQPSCAKPIAYCSKECPPYGAKHGTGMPGDGPPHEWHASRSAHRG